MENKPHIFNGESWAVMPGDHHVIFEAAAGEYPPIWLSVDHARVGSQKSHQFEATDDGWVSVVGVRFRSDESDSPMSPGNLVIQYSDQALALSEALIDAVSRQRRELMDFKGEGVQACRVVSGIASAANRRVHAIINDSTALEAESEPLVQLLDPYEELGHLELLEEFHDRVEVTARGLSIGRRLALVEDLAETFVLLGFACPYTDYRNRVEGLLAYVLHANPSLGGAAWKAADTTRTHLRNAIEERISRGVGSKAETEGLLLNVDDTIGALIEYINNALLGSSES